MIESSTNREPHALADDIGAAIACVGELLRAETAAVEKRQNDALTRILDDKRAAAKRCRVLAQELAARPDAGELWTAAQRTGLQQALRGIRDAVRTNARTLHAEIEARGQLMRALDRAVQKRTAAGSVYEHGARAKAQGVRHGTASVLFNQVA